jgi:uncharacterized protein (TIGR00369 family)
VFLVQGVYRAFSFIGLGIALIGIGLLYQRLLFPPPPPIQQTLGFRLTEAESGRAVFEGVPEFRHYNPIGSVHAGFAATLLDSALYCAIHSTLPKGEVATTLEIKINLVRGLTRDTGNVRAEGRVIHRGRTTATATARCATPRASFTPTPPQPAWSSQQNSSSLTRRRCCSPPPTRSAAGGRPSARPANAD